MRTIILLSSLFATAIAEIKVAALGSSYAFGARLHAPYGQVLANKLAQAEGTTANFQNFAVVGSTLDDVMNNQARKLGFKDWDAVVMSSGGNDMLYVSCLQHPTDSACPSKLSQGDFKARFSAALHAVHLNLPLTPWLQYTPVYVVTYPKFLGDYHYCKPENPDCPLNGAEVSSSIATYNHLIDWTLQAVDEFNLGRLPPLRKVKLVPMRQLSAGHEVGSGASYVNGALMPADGNGTAFHPTQLAADFIGDYIFQDIEHGKA